MLFYGGRTRGEMPYLDDLAGLADRGALHVDLALSREPGRAKTYVQDALLADAERIASFLDDPKGLIYICGIVSMEHGAMAALAEICARAGKDWEQVRLNMLAEGRLHIETY